MKVHAHVDVSAIALHRHLGSDTTPGALRVYFARHITPKVQLIRDTVNNGVDPKDLNLESVSKLSGTGKRYFSNTCLLHVLKPAHIDPRLQKSSSSSALMLRPPASNSNLLLALRNMSSS